MNELSVILFIVLAGPLVGSYFGVYRRYSEKHIRFMLSFAAGVMVSVSVFELMPESYRGGSLGTLLAGLFLGGIVMHLLNIVLPHFHHSECGREDKAGRIRRTAFFIFLGISIHNLPEGLAIGIGALADFNFSLLIALTGLRVITIISSARMIFWRSRQVIVLA